MQVYIDAAKDLSCLGRFINDPHGSGSSPNLAFDKQPGRARAALVCVSPINQGDELLADYGSQYWRGHTLVSNSTNVTHTSTNHIFFPDGRIDGHSATLYA